MANNSSSVTIVTDQPKFSGSSAQEGRKWGTVIESIIDNVSVRFEDGLKTFSRIFYLCGKNYDSHSKNIISLTFPLLCMCVSISTIIHERKH